MLRIFRINSVIFNIIYFYGYILVHEFNTKTEFKRDFSLVPILKHRFIHVVTKAVTTQNNSILRKPNVYSNLIKLDSN